MTISGHRIGERNLDASVSWRIWIYKLLGAGLHISEPPQTMGGSQVLEGSSNMISEIIGSHHPGENFSRPYGALKGPQILVTLLVCTLAY